MGTIAKLGVAALLVFVGTYFYVMGLCYLCDLYEQKKLAKQRAEEKKRKERLHRAIEETEKKRKSETERRRRLAQARMQSRGGPPTATKSPERATPPRSTSAAQ